MNFTEQIRRTVDWTVGIISAKRAARRAHFRHMERDPMYRETVFALMRTRGYRSAKGSSGPSWLGMSRTADAEITTDLPKLREKSRELNRDDPIASGLTGTFVRNVIGTGLRGQARTGDPDKNNRIEAVWNERHAELDLANNLTHGEGQALKFRKVLEDGEVIVKETRRFDGEPVWFETIEADRLAAPMGQRPEIEGGQIRDGVEKDAAGVPVAYWIRRLHPGDLLANAGRNIMKADRFDADVIRHLKFTERPGQSRGVPMFHAILQDLADLDLLLLAGLKRVQIAACLAVFLQTPEAIEDTLDVTAQKYGYKLDQALEPGMVFKTFPGEEVSTLVPNFPTPEFGPFIVVLARRIGAAVGVSWQVVLKDFSQSSYSSARSDLLESRQVYQVFQRWFIARYMNWEWRTVLEDARLRGDVRLADATAADLALVDWIGDGWEWVDPLKGAKAVELKLRAGLTTLQEECAKLGKDWERVVAQRKIEKAALEAAGLLDSKGDKASAGRLMENMAMAELIAIVRDLVDAIEDNDETGTDASRGLGGGNGDGRLLGVSS